jgi:hypothetical protein
MMGCLEPAEMPHIEQKSSPRPPRARWNRGADARLPATRPDLFASLALCALLAATACDGAAPAVDASTPPSARTSAVSLRIDVPIGKPASLTVLAFQAAFWGVNAADVLGLVDPMAAAAPARDCQLRDVGQAAAALVARGDAIELEELSGVAVSLGTDATEIHPSPRLYPDLAATIGGVVGEAGPFGLVSVPEQVRVQSAIAGIAADGPSDTTTILVPATGWVKLVNGAVPRDGSLVQIGADLNIGLTAGVAKSPDGKPGDAETSIELRPFGATVALSCVVPVDPSTASSGGQTTFMIPRQALLALVAASGATPGTSVAAGLDLVRRSNQRLPLSATRVSLEVRTSTFVELHP